MALFRLVPSFFFKGAHSFFFFFSFGSKFSQLIRLILINIMLTRNVWYFVYIVRPCLNMLGCED